MASLTPSETSFVPQTSLTCWSRRKFKDGDEILSRFLPDLCASTSEKVTVLTKWDHSTAVSIFKKSGRNEHGDRGEVGQMLRAHKVERRAAALTVFERSSDGSLTDKMNAQISKVRSTSDNSHHLRHQGNISLSHKGGEYQITLLAVLLYGFRTWPLRTPYMEHLQVIDHGPLTPLARIALNQQIRNEIIK
ncbi:hypothetical protein CLF_102462 [Clonorchis sinensis]|uniref:Uncharacterized protein n=1 Tax=Clonorchis sinensis TaxID=79923 RepID=G7Y7Z9_CLOSI|nr:hypothetical protein CLF_102462 [Clonorchis sinensis]